MALFVVGVDSLADVLAIRTAAMQSLASGSTVMSWTSEGTSVTKVNNLPTSLILEETALFILESSGLRISRTSPSFC